LPLPSSSTLFPYTTLFRSHYLLEKEASAGRMPTLLELLLTAHELEASIRPNLLRMLWIARRSTDDRSKKYSDLQLNPTGRTNRRDRKSTRLNSSHQIISYA